MKWNTIYIEGRNDFWEDVNKKIFQSDLNFLPGHMEQRADAKFHGLYWLDSKVDLRAFKEAIGGKIIWKYRLQFCLELEEKKEDEVQEKSVPLSDKENGMITAMRSKVALEF